MSLNKSKRLSKELRKIYENKESKEDPFIRMARYVNKLLQETNNSAYSRGHFDGLSQ